ncbi:hypothetical protein PC9H_007981 [Pleurotus ostreatus]|uniref:BZIP domain-containing protein n=1 Tax=Pleurotus ostreatus TaxID=5322 RepID=A0A8H7DS64_PLEOS|nr:uncharacterized protein PC9H_007981 [Pleurotus ostreatus]KAF7428749.1 hypothetical protein PC9H_007981 [Pleurotus ostreatus]KAJ8696952.1 hypothetical protein PTI98_006773 [Pleurotus ostreatus]
MSHLLSQRNHHHHDSSLLSPISPLDTNPWHNQLYSPVNDYGNYFAASTPSSSSSSSSPTDSMFKMRLSPESSSASDSEQPQLCLPTHKLFDFTTGVVQEHHQFPPPAQPKLSTVAIASMIPSKRCSESPPPAAKKRTIGERINSKDFVPPDVTGLSKREARLVKNRAAAFLSRQRKREEFEAMEIRVAELEQENARLQAIAQNGGTSAQAVQAPPAPSKALTSEVERLRAQLAAAEARERELNAELALRKEQPSVKVEAPEAQYPLSDSDRSSSNTPVNASSKSNASLGLMVLLCALPSLLSMPAQSTNVPSTFSLPTALSSSASSFDFNPFLPNDFDWTSASSDPSQIPTPKPSFTLPKRLEFADIDAEALRALGDLDISFDTTPSENGKIRVRILPSTSATSSRAASPASSSSSSSHSMKLDDQIMSFGWADDSASAAGGAAVSASGFNDFTSVADFGLASQDDPFLGIGGISDYLSSTSSMSMGYASATSGTQSPTSSVSSELPANEGTSKRRVRIALKSLPKEGGEGGEWEVQVC